MLALLRGERLLGLLADLLGELEHLDALREQRQHFVEPLLDIDRFQHVLFFRRLGVENAGDEIGERRGRIQILDGRGHLHGHVRHQLDGFAGARSEQADARLDLGRHHLGDADFLDARHQKREPGQVLEHAKAPHALRDHVMRAVGSSDVAQNLRGGPHAVQLLGRRLLDRGIGLQDDAEHALAANRLLGSRDGRFAPDRQGQHDPGKQHRLPHRQQDHAVGRERRMAALIGCFLLGLICHGACLSDINAAASGSAAGSRSRASSGPLPIARQEDVSVARSARAVFPRDEWRCRARRSTAAALRR